MWLCLTKMALKDNLGNLLLLHTFTHTHMPPLRKVENMHSRNMTITLSFFRRSVFGERAVMLLDLLG